MKFSEFAEDQFGTQPRRPAREGARHPRGHTPVERYRIISQDQHVEEINKPMSEDPGTNPRVDLTPNFPNYTKLIGEFLGVKNNKVLFQIVTADLQPGNKPTEKIVKAMTANRPIAMALNYVRNRQVVDSAVEESQLVENLRKWFKEKWVRFGPDGKIRGDCARGDDSEGKPKCLPQSKAHALGKKGRKYAAAKKRREDPNPERSGKAINVATKKKTEEAANPAQQAAIAIAMKKAGKKPQTNEQQLDEKCWDTHRQVGMKKKGDRMVPNCVPKEDVNEGGYEYMPPGASVSDTRRMLDKVGTQKLIWKRPGQIGGSHTDAELRNLGLRYSQQYNKWGGTSGQWNKLSGIKEVSDQTLINYLTKVDADARKHPADPTRRSAEKRNKSVSGFSRAFNKLDARKDTPVKEDDRPNTPMKMQDYLDRAEELHRQMMAASARRDEHEYERIKRLRAELDAQGRRGMVPESSEQERQLYSQAAKDIIKGADPDHIARVRKLDPEILRKHVDWAWEKVNSGEYKLNRPNLEEAQKCPKCGGPMFSDLMLAEKQDACYHKVKSRYKVWPSAYASGALVQCRKKGAKNWGNKK